MSAKKKEELDEKEADPISFELNRIICKLALESGKVFVRFHSDAMVVYGAININ